MIWFPAERSGWISRRSVPQTGKPDRNVFSITPAGHEELISWLRGDLPAGVRNPLLMKTFFMGELPAEENLAFFRSLRDAPVFPDGGKQASEKAGLYEQAVSRPEKAVYWKLTIEFGRMYEQMQRRWCEYCIRELESLQRMNEAAAQKEEA